MAEIPVQDPEKQASEGAHASRRYPLFINPDEYLHLRQGGLPVRYFKQWFERRALNRCLRNLVNVHTVCDCPCGPGRLFPYWKRRSYAVIGVDLSDPMLAEAAIRHRALGLRGSVHRGDAFHLGESLPQTPDLVVSVRFCYYFDRPGRSALLRSFGEASRQYVLVQYKTAETRRGRRTFARVQAKKDHPRPKQFCTYAEMRREIEDAGLKCLRIVPISRASDRVFVLAEKRG